MVRAQIISSNSHIDYIARLTDEAEAGPARSAFDFARFVKLAGADGSAVGIVYDSKLLNPQFKSYGPRLSRNSGLGDLPFDLVDQQTSVVGIILIGTIATDGSVTHGVPPAMLASGTEAEAMSTDEVVRFHTSADGRIQLHYFSQVKANAGLMAIPLIEAVIAQLMAHCSDTDARALRVLRETLLWERTIGSLRG
jgi:hypothetical protein